MQLAQKLQELALRLVECPQRPQLIAVTKGRPLSVIQEAYSCGLRDFGENRLEELLEKSKLVAEWGNYPDLRWHFIGNLQSKKIKKLLSIPQLKYIHSVGSLAHLQILVQYQNSLGFFIQVNTSQEEEKGGVPWQGEELEEMISWWKNFSDNNSCGLSWVGLMTMAGIRQQNLSGEEEAQLAFSRLLQLRNSLEEKFPATHIKLSMGMSGDWETALKYQSDFIRIGSFLFQ